MSQLFNVARTGTSGTQVTTGVRGLDAKQIANAQPNPAELAKLKDFAVDRDAAASFAAEALSAPRWSTRNERSWLFLLSPRRRRQAQFRLPTSTSTGWSTP